VNAAKPTLVVNKADLLMAPLVSGPWRGASVGIVLFEPREASPQGEQAATASAYKVVPPGLRISLFSAMHSDEEVAFIVSGNGEYHAGQISFSVRQGDFLLAPEGMPGDFEIENTGSDELAFVAFQSRGHTINLSRRDWARAVIDSYIKSRFGRGTTMNWEGYKFDGRVLSVYDKEFTMVVTYDQFGAIWVNGHRLQRTVGETIETHADRLSQLERKFKAERSQTKSDAISASA
jgi:mannose-6-phosphate isomerase-like protein (cupin superfamily)